MDPGGDEVRVAMESGNPPIIILVDDEPSIVDLVSRFLSEAGYRVYPFSNGADALKKLQEEPADLVLTDIRMPVMTGIELLHEIRTFDQDMPVLLMTGYAELDSALAAIKCGASDFIVKPLNLPDLGNAIEKAVGLNRKRQMESASKNMLEKEFRQTSKELVQTVEVVSNMSRVVIELLSLAAGSRNEYTRMHNSRVGILSSKISRAIGMQQDFIETITMASSMQDAWKGVIPQSIKEKIASLTSHDFQLIQAHSSNENSILKATTYPMLQMAASIAMTCMEHWDGTGHPNRLQGEDIPVEGRIVLLVDTYIELRRSTPFDPSRDHETAYKMITEGDDKIRPEHFDPKVLMAFKELSAEFAELFDSYSASDHRTTTLN